MLIDYKINYILSKEQDIYSKIHSRVDTDLRINGTADLTYVTQLDFLFDMLSKSILTGNLQLEIYKKLIHLLRFFGIMYKIPKPSDNDNPILYWGAGDSGLNVASLQGLTTSILDFSTQLSFNYTLTNKVYYFCYPADKGDLSSILDNNGFETLPGWTKRTESFVFAGLSNVTYNVYEFNNITTQSSFTNTFIL